MRKKSPPNTNRMFYYDFLILLYISLIIAIFFWKIADFCPIEILSLYSTIFISLYQQIIIL